MWWPELFIKMQLQWKIPDANQLAAILQVNATTFNNKEILIENQTIFYKEWFQKGIFLVLGSFTGKWPTSYISGLHPKVWCWMQFFKLYASCSAIPKHLLDKAKGKQVDKRTFLAENAFQLSPNTAIDLHKMKNRDYYWLLINKDDVEIKATPTLI